MKDAFETTAIFIYAVIATILYAIGWVIGFVGYIFAFIFYGLRDGARYHVVILDLE